MYVIIVIPFRKKNTKQNRKQNKTNTKTNTKTKTKTNQNKQKIKIFPGFLAKVWKISLFSAKIGNIHLFVSLALIHVKGGYAHFSMYIFTFNWLTLTYEMHFVKFHPKVASFILSRGKRKYAPLGMRILWKYIRNYFLVYQLTPHFFSYLQNYKEFEAEILDLQLEKYELSFDTKNVLLPVEPWGMRMWSA